MANTDAISKLDIDLTDIGLPSPISRRGPGRKKQQIEFVVDRELTEQDLAEREQAVVVSTPSPLQKISQRHRAAARSLAQGEKVSDVAFALGYNVSTLSSLKSDPAFKELIEHYRHNQDDDHYKVQTKLNRLGAQAADMLLERLEDPETEVSNGHLLEIITKTADRTGHGPQTMNTNVNVEVSMAERLSNARKRLEDAQVIEHSEEESKEPT